MQKYIFLPLLLCALTSFGATQPSPKSIKPWINDEKILDSIDDVIENDELAIDIGQILQDAPKTCTLIIPSKRYSSPSNLYQFCSPSVVIISRSGYCKKCDKVHGRASGSGFFISADGVIATNYHLVDHDDPRDAGLERHAVDTLGLNLDAIRRTHQNDRGIRAGHGVDRVVDEVRIARGIEDVDLVSVVLQPGQARTDGATALVLLGLEVEQRGPVVDPTQAIGRTAQEKHRFCQ